MTLDDLANGLEAAAHVLRCGHTSAAWRMTRTLLPELERIALARPEPIKAVLPRAIASVKLGNEGEG